MSNKIKVKLQKLKAVFEHPNTPVHEADTAKRIYDKLLKDHNLTESDFDPIEIQLLKKYNVDIVEDVDGERTYYIHGDDQTGVDMALHDIFTQAINKRRKQRLGKEERKQLEEKSNEKI